MAFLQVTENDILLSQSDASFLAHEPTLSLVPIHFYEEVLQLVLIRPGKVLLMWNYPFYIIEEYDFCPDQRILTHRLIGKPALGPSPPCYNSIICNNAGFVYSRSQLN